MLLTQKKKLLKPATVVDENGVTISIDSDVNVTFSILSGPARILATHNGNPANLSPSHAPWTMTYGGLARCFVRVTTDAASLSRNRIVQIDAEIEPNVKVLNNLEMDKTSDDARNSNDNIVVGVQAKLHGGRTVRSNVEIPVSRDIMAHSVQSLVF